MFELSKTNLPNLPKIMTKHNRGDSILAYGEVFICEYFSKKENRYLFVTKKKFLETLKKRQEQKQLIYNNPDTLRHLQMIDNYKINQKCQICEYCKKPEGLIFDHLITNNKTFDISYLIHKLRFCVRKQKKEEYYQLIWIEIGKCQVLCGTCHLEKTQENKDGYANKLNYIDLSSYYDRNPNKKNIHLLDLNKE